MTNERRAPMGAYQRVGGRTSVCARVQRVERLRHPEQRIVRYIAAWVVCYDPLKLTEGRGGALLLHVAHPDAILRVVDALVLSVTLREGPEESARP